MEISDLLSLHLPQREDEPAVSRVLAYKYNHELMRMNDEKGILAFDTHYDREGRTIQQTSYGPSGIEMDRIKLEYNAEGMISKKETYAEGVLAETEVNYFEGERLVKTEIFYSGDLGTVIHTIWNENDLIVEIRNEDDEGEVELKVTKDYDEKKNLLEEVHTYDWGGEARFVYTYDDQGNQITLRATDQDGNLVRNIENTYDSEGNLATRKFRDFQSGESYNSKHSVQEENGKSVHVVELSDGSVQKIVLNDVAGDLAEEFVIYGPDKGIRLQQSFKYENGFRKEETYFRRGVDHHRLEYKYEFYD